MLKSAFLNINEPNFAPVKKSDIKGIDGERFSASALTMALNARISWASRKEDNAKADLIITMLHPWKKNKAEVILCQVKAGHTYAKIINENPTKTKYEKSEFKDYLNNRNPFFICWVNTENHQVFWFIIKANSKFLRNEFGPLHKLSPATRYDLMRILNGFEYKSGGKGLQFSVLNSNEKRGHKYDKIAFKNLRDVAKRKYSELKKIKGIDSEIFGPILFTNFGWRHITRESRWSKYKVSSYEILPILKPLLKSSPTKHYIQNFSEESDKSQKYRKVEYLLEYNNVKMFCKENSKLLDVKAYVKIIEIIKYPKNWKTNSSLTTEIKRRVKFKSIYYKCKSD
ncbi:MAG: hypothetical protein R2879_20805 [Saprospiraceae bacterium]